MLSQSVIEKILDAACLRGADFAEVFDENTLFHETEVSQERIESTSQGRESGAGVRLFKGTSCYYGYTNQKTEDALLKLVHALTRQMKTGGAGKIALQAPTAYGMEDGTKYPSGLSFEKRLVPAREAVGGGMAYDPEIVQMKVKLTDFDQSVQIANSQGLYVQDRRVKTRLYVSAYAQNETGTQRGYFGPGAMRGHEYYDLFSPEEWGREAARQAKVLLHSDPCPGGQMSVVVANGFGGLLFHEACGHSLEAGGIVKGASEFCGRLGEKVASDVVTLVDDGSIPHEWGSLHVDDEGTPVRKNVLIEKGILKSYLVDRLNGLRGGMESTGSARRQNYKFAPVARMTNTYIAPGKRSPEEIIAGTEKGLYVKAIIGGSVQPATGDFNFSTGECWLIENGRLTRPVRGATLIGNGLTVLNNVDMTGNDFELRQGFCYAGSGALFIGAGQPTIRVSNMTVGGMK